MADLLCSEQEIKPWTADINAIKRPECLKHDIGATFDW
jgi:hypothetical protein